MWRCSRRFGVWSNVTFVYVTFVYMTFVYAGCDSKTSILPKAQTSSLISSPIRFVKYKSAPLSTDPQIESALKTVLEKCTFHGLVEPPESCPNGEFASLKNAIKLRGRASLETLVMATSSTRVRKQLVGSWLVKHIFEAAWLDESRATLSGPLVARLQEITLRADRVSAISTAAVTVHATALAGDLEPWLERIHTHQDDLVRAHTYRASMVFGRLGSFRSLLPIFQNDNTSHAVRVSIMKASLKMSYWTQEERVHLCRFARELIMHKSKDIMLHAKAMLARCGGNDVEVLYEQAHTRLERHEYDRADNEALARVCVDKKRREVLLKRHCDRVRHTLEHAVKSPWLISSDRVFALHTLGIQWPDNQTLMIAKAYSEDKDTELKSESRHVVSLVETAVLQRVKEEAVQGSIP